MSLEVERRGALVMEESLYLTRDMADSAGQGKLRKLADALLSQAFVGNLLRIGVFVSIAVTALGSVLFFVYDGLGGHLQALVRYTPNPAFPHTLGMLGQGIVHSVPFAIITLGLLLLVALRVFQVLLSAATFAAKRNFKFMFISLFVFGVLISSLFLGKAGG